MNAQPEIPEGLFDNAFDTSSKVPVVTATVEDILSEDHLQEYLAKSGSLETTQKSDEKDIATLRAKHHQVARLLAANLPEGIVAEMTGYSAAYLSTLKSNPSMIELISHYRAPGDHAVQMIAEKLRTVGDAALNKLLEKMEENGLDANQLLAAAKLGADRTGNGPQQKVEHNHNHVIDLDKARELARTSRERNKERVIPLDSIRPNLALPSPEDED